VSEGLPYESAPEEAGALSAINTTPLVDVMLVLLIIVLITVPVVAALPPVALPRERAAPLPPETGAVTVSLTADGRLFWNETALPDAAALAAHLAALAAQPARPPLRLHGDENVPYAEISRLVAACRAAGITRVGFLTDPHPEAPR